MLWAPWPVPCQHHLGRHSGKHRLVWTEQQCKGERSRRQTTMRCSSDTGCPAAAPSLRATLAHPLVANGKAPPHQVLSFCRAFSWPEQLPKAQQRLYHPYQTPLLKINNCRFLHLDCERGWGKAPSSGGAAMPLHLSKGVCISAGHALGRKRAGLVWGTVGKLFPHAQRFLPAWERDTERNQCRDPCTLWYRVNWCGRKRKEVSETNLRSWISINPTEGFSHRKCVCWITEAINRADDPYRGFCAREEQGQRQP